MIYLQYHGQLNGPLVRHFIKLRLMKSILILLFFGVSLSTFSQGDFDKRLLAKFSEEQILKMEADHQNSLEYWEYYLDNSYIVVDVPAGKSADEFPALKYKSAEKFNILEEDITMDSVAKKHYQISGTNKMLVLLSSKEFTEKFNEYRANQ